MHWFTKGFTKVSRYLLISALVLAALITMSAKGVNQDEIPPGVDKPIKETQELSGYNNLKMTRELIPYITPKGLPIMVGDVNIEPDVESLDSDIEIPEETVYIEIPHTEEDKRALECVVEGEAYQSTLEHKQMVACVVINRFYSDRWDYNSILDVLIDKNQFSAVSNYYHTYYEPDGDTIEAVRSVLAGEVNIDEFSQGAVFFYSPKYAGGYLNSFEKREFLFEIGGNRFFK